MKSNGNGYARTSRETYSSMIGYDFGGLVYDGGYWDTETGKKQYVFIEYDASGKDISQTLVDYKGFREIVDRYDFPGRRYRK